MGRWSDTMNLRHIRAMDYFAESFAGTVVYAMVVALYGLSLLGENPTRGFGVLQRFFFPRGTTSFTYCVMAMVSQVVQDMIAKAVLRSRVGMIPNRIFGRFWTDRTMSWAVVTGTGGVWFSTCLMMLAQFFSEPLPYSF